MLLLFLTGRNDFFLEDRITSGKKKLLLIINNNIKFGVKNMLQYYVDSKISRPRIARDLLLFIVVSPDYVIFELAMNIIN